MLTPRSIHGILLAALLLASANSTRAQQVETRLGPVMLDHGLPTPETRQALYDAIDFQRAVQAVIWADPINAGFFDMWMRPVHDFGTVGPNKGKGDRILLVPPGYSGPIPDGYQVARAKTYQLFSITRLSVKDGMTAAQATAIMQRIRTYRLGDAAAPPAKPFVLMGDPAQGGKAFRMRRAAGLEYWKVLHGIVDGETIEDRDRVTLGTIATIGIERGTPFSPDERMQRILVDAEVVGHLMMVNEAFSPRYVTDGVTKELYPGTQWENIALLPSMTQEGDTYTHVVPRMIGFYQANGAQFAWDPRDYPPGFGQKYAATYKDGSGA